MSVSVVIGLQEGLVFSGLFFKHGFMSCCIELQFPFWAIKWHGHCTISHSLPSSKTQSSHTREDWVLKVILCTCHFHLLCLPHHPSPASCFLLPSRQLLLQVLSHWFPCFTLQISPGFVPRLYRLVTQEQISLLLLQLFSVESIEGRMRWGTDKEINAQASPFFTESNFHREPNSRQFGLLCPLAGPEKSARFTLICLLWQRWSPVAQKGLPTPII